MRGDRPPQLLPMRSPTTIATFTLSIRRLRTTLRLPTITMTSLTLGTTLWLPTISCHRYHLSRPIRSTSKELLDLRSENDQLKQQLRQLGQEPTFDSESYNDHGVDQNSGAVPHGEDRAQLIKLLDQLSLSEYTNAIIDSHNINGLSDLRNFSIDQFDGLAMDMQMVRGGGECAPRLLSSTLSANSALTFIP